jgi:GrpB-like predicted nucleotidyltransferase (UPF0157 family)
MSAVVEVVAYSDDWPGWFDRVARDLRSALAHVAGARVEHVGSTSVTGLAAKPVLDVDVVVAPRDVASAVAALTAIGYVHRGDLGVTGREAFAAPDQEPRRNVYVCAAGTLAVRNHLAVREVLRRRDDLRDAYAAVKLGLAARPGIDTASYVAGKSAVLQRVLAASDLTEAERHEIWRLNDPSHTPPAAGRE